MNLTADIRRYPSEILSDSHSYHQLIVGVRGTLALEVAGKGGEISLTQGCLVPVDEHHHYEGRNGNANLVLDVSVDHCAPAGLFDRVRYFPVDTSLRQFLRFAATELPRHSASSAYARQLGSLFLTSLAPRLGARPPAQAYDLAVIDDYLDRHLSGPIQVADLARLWLLSNSQFTSRFQELTGDTPYQYLLRHRTARALALLETSNIPIAEVAQACGFAHQSALNRALRRHAGLTPGELRRRALDRG